MATVRSLQMWIFIFVIRTVTTVEWGSSSRWRCEENNFRFLLTVVGTDGDHYCIGRTVRHNETWVGSVLQGTEVIMYADDLNRTRVGNSFELLRYHPSTENLQFVWQGLTFPLGSDIINARADVGSSRYVASYHEGGRVYIGYLDKRRICINTFDDRQRTAMWICGRGIYVLKQVPKRRAHSENCISGWGTDYMGTISTTRSGLTCQYWTAQRPSSHRMSIVGVFPDASISDARNFCRNPDGYVTPWCYTTQPEVNRWEPCDIPQCPRRGTSDVTNTVNGDITNNVNNDVTNKIDVDIGGNISGVNGNVNGDVSSNVRGDVSGNFNGFGEDQSRDRGGSASFTPLPTHMVDTPQTTVLSSDQGISLSGLEIWLPFLLALLLLLILAILCVFCKHHQRHRRYHTAANRKAQEIQKGLTITQVGRNLSGSQTATKNDRAGSPAVPFQSYPAVLPPPGQRDIQLPTKRSKRSFRNCLDLPVVPLDVEEDFTYEEIATPRTAKHIRKKEQKRRSERLETTHSDTSQAPTLPPRNPPKTVTSNDYAKDDDDSDYVPPTPSIRESVADSMPLHLDLSGHHEIEFGAIPYPEITHIAEGATETDHYKPMDQSQSSSSYQANTTASSGSTTADVSDDSQPRYIISE